MNDLLPLHNFNYLHSLLKSTIQLILSFIIMSFIGFSKPVYGQLVQQPVNYNIWGGYSFNSVRFLGKTQQAQTQIIGIGYQRKIRAFPQEKTLWYTADVIPYIHYSYPKRDENDRRVNRSGYGISPVGFKLIHQYNNSITPFLQTTGGLIFMESNFPTDQAQRLNFTFDITLGANIQLYKFLSLSAGYKFHHISNAETGEENPGLDSNVLFLTLTLK